MNYFLGIDGGGTRTVAWLADDEGKVVARAEAGPSNPHKVGLVAAQREILKSFRACCRQAGFSAAAQAARPPALRTACAGIAGGDRPSVQRPLLAWMHQHVPARHYLLTSDAVIMLAAAVRDAPGIIVNAGTGSIAIARDDQGKLLRAGGWGVPYDDLGSGYELGRGAVAAALEAFDGRGPRTLLQDLLCRHLKLAVITEVVSKRLEPPQIAALFPVVLEAARAGDRVASHLCDAAARDLASLAAALLKRVGWAHRAQSVVTTGGVFQSSLAIRRAFARYLHHFAPLARVVLLVRPPVEGALWLASCVGKKNPG